MRTAASRFIVYTIFTQFVTDYWDGHSYGGTHVGDGSFPQQNKHNGVHVNSLELHHSMLWAGDFERRLYDKLLSGYNKLARPVKNESEPVRVLLGLDFQQILDVDEKAQVMHSNVWLRMSWIDHYLTWDPSQYGNIKEVRLPIESIWKPDVLLYNSVDQQFDSTWPVNAVIYHTGNVTWIPPAVIHSSCSIDIAYFPFDTQHCSMKFGSWTYSGFFTDLRNSSVSVATYQPNGEWQLLGLTSKRSIFYYECCPEPYYDVSFTLIIRRRTLYYGFNFVLPSMLISALALLGFTLPADSGEKLNLCVTIFMSHCLLMLMVAEKMPQTSDALPLIEIYFSCIMFEVGASVICTVWALNLHYRTPEGYKPMSKLTRKILLEWLPALLGMERPMPYEMRIQMNGACTKYRDKKTARYLVDANRNVCNGTPKSERLKTVHLDLDSTGVAKVREERRSFPLSMPPSIPLDNTLVRASNLTRYKEDTACQKTPPMRLDDRQFRGLISELRTIAARVTKEEFQHDERTDWMFASMVVDRMCLISFSAFLAVCTLVIAYKAPHLFA